jgi:molybdopterin molybdotransferase
LLEAPGDDSFIRRAGSDFCNGDLLLPAGTTLHPGAVGLVAAANCPSPWVHRRAKIGILTCGDELVAPGSALEPGWTIDSASYALAALVREWGGVAQRIGHVADSAAASEATLTRALPAFDVVITVGGASVGTRDHFRSAARAIGMDLRFEKISVQPGKPCWHARTAWGGLCLGLPGNPTSAFVCAHLLLRPLLARLHGSDRELLRTVRARLAGPPVSSGERRSFQRGWLDDHVGVLMVQAARDQDSGLQSTLASANCLIDLPPHTRLLSGDVVRVLRLGSETGTMTPPGRLVERNGAALHEP